MAATSSITKRQREVLDHLSEHAAFTRDKAHMVYGADSNLAEKLAANGVINKRYDTQRGAVYWIRAEDEAATTASVPAGFVVILHRHVTTPSGRTENMFLARATWDGKQTAFRKLLRGWMSALDLRNKDLLSGAWGVEIVPADATIFNGDHVILDASSKP